MTGTFFAGMSTGMAIGIILSFTGMIVVLRLAFQDMELERR